MLAFLTISSLCLIQRLRDHVEKEGVHGETPTMKPEDMDFVASFLKKLPAIPDLDNHDRKQYVLHPDAKKHKRGRH